MTLIIIGCVAFLVFIVSVVSAGFKSADEEYKKRKGLITEEEIKTTKLSADHEKVLKVSRQLILDERLLSNKIKNEDVRASLNPALDRAEDILNELIKDPSEISSTKQFLNYYIPVLDEILKKFIKLEASGTDISLETDKILTYLADINKAMDRQYNNLFDDDKLDLSVEMEAMTLAFQRDGLITESDYNREEAEKKIELTLA